MNKTDIIVVGGGLAGCASALALHQLGYDVRLVEAVPEERWQQPLTARAYALSAASLRLLRSLGLGEMLASHSGPIRTVQVFDPGDSFPGHVSPALDLSAAELGEPLGAMVEDGALRPALISALDEAEIPILHSVTVEDLGNASGRTVLQMSDGLAWCADLVVAADGAESLLRRMADIHTIRHDYDQAALSCVIAHEREHHGVAQQVFLAGGPLAILPLNGQRCNIVWSDKEIISQQRAELQDQEFLALLQEQVGAALGALKLLSQRKVLPLRLRVAQRLHHTGLALVGDAARTVHPVAGQGLNAGLRDVAELVEQVAGARRLGQSPGDINVLEAYNAARRSDSLGLAMFTDGVLRLYGGGVAHGLRSMGMRAVQSYGPARRELMKQAAGLGGVVPSSMQRQA